MVVPYTASPFLVIKRFEYSGWVIKNETNITLSGFWAISTPPDFVTFQGSHSWDFFLYISSWWSGGLANLTAYPVTISWTTATLGTANTIPVVASYTVRHIFAKNTDLYAYYSLTASPYTSDVGRKWTGGSWNTLTGNALLSSVGSFGTNSWVSSGTQSCCPCWASWEWAYIYESGGPNSTNTWARLNTTTDTWELENRIRTAIMSDINWYLHTAWTLIMNDDSSVVTNTSIPSEISDIHDWLLHSVYSSQTHYFNGNLIWNNRRIRKIHSPSRWSNYWMLYSLDWWTTWKGLQYLSTLISENYNLNYVGNIICIPFNNTTIIWVYIEIV